MNSDRCSFPVFYYLCLSAFICGRFSSAVMGEIDETQFARDVRELTKSPSRIVGSVVRHGVGLAGFGIAIGLWAAYALSRFMQGILYDVAATDTMTYLAVAALLAGCAAAASILPARWAARLDPVRALRDE